MPGRVVLLQREIEFEGRHSAGVALYFRQLATHTVRLETDEQCAASVTVETHTSLDFLNLNGGLDFGEFNSKRYIYPASVDLFGEETFVELIRPFNIVVFVKKQLLAVSRKRTLVARNNIRFHSAESFQNG